MVAGLTLSLLNNVKLDFSLVTFNALMEAVFIVIVAMFGAVILAYFGIKHVLSHSRYGLALTTVMSSDDGFIASKFDKNTLIGAKGKAYSILRPAGKIEIDNKIYDAVSSESYINKGEEIVVMNYVNNQLVVRKQ